ncbi:MAG: hydroxysqualene dehydroxylase HpnE [Bryobacteraceae bacterium]|nr:hydroxysqualene dehydroxylase HpnE [Bryobacteraceae bacterium]MDW8376801.1 hydroxysqualene dehydroxylase HpnE [Bryobacterales bacterium]
MTQVPPRVAIAGGGLAGMAAAAALGSAGFEVDLYEARSFLGGRAASYPLPNSGEAIDNCQHILLGCCTNLRDFYARLGVEGKVRFDRTYYFLEPGGRRSQLRAAALPAPFHFLGSFIRLRFLSASDKLAVARALLAILRERNGRTDLDQITMLEWLKEKKQPPRAIDRFWRQILVSAVNEELDRMAACHGFQVFWLGFLTGSRNSEMGVPAVPLGELYCLEAWKRLPQVRLHFRTPVEQIVVRDGRASVVVAGAPQEADFVISALPLDKLRQVAPLLPLSELDCSPITGIHLWFDRPVTDLPHATLLDRTVQWFFNRAGGRYLLLVVSASRSLLELSRAEIIELAIRELAEFLPAVRQASLERAHVVKEVRATFSASPQAESLRARPETLARNLFLAGDWTRTGWPATMEGAVRSGYLAAEAVARAAGCPHRFLLPDPI